MKLETLTASQAAKLLENKEVSSVELTQACLERIELRNGEVGAFAHIDPEFSLKQAALADSEPRRSSKGSLLE